MHSIQLAYIRGPEGIIVGLAEDIQKSSPRTGIGVARPKPVSRAKPAGGKQTAHKGGGARKKRKS